MDEEPRGVFSIDKFTGKVSLNAMLDREKTDRFRVGPPPPIPAPFLHHSRRGPAHTSACETSVLSWGQRAGFGTRSHRGRCSGSLAHWTDAREQAEVCVLPGRTGQPAAG